MPEEKKTSGQPIQPTILPTQSLPSGKIDPDAIKVIHRLHRFGHSAYLVGGCVRDLLLKKSPKDFDVATSAHPQQLRKIFRNCRLIGRRFRLAHIHFRGKIIETATFRAHIENGQNDDLLIRSDNVFGTEEEDACRRDFSINALFYDPEERLLIDYVGGLEDLVNRTVWFIGPPSIRVQEDPVRILRAIKFAARLGFEIEPESWNAMVCFRDHLAKSAPPRLLEEIIRMLRGGASEKAFSLMQAAGVFFYVLPEVFTYLKRLEEEQRCSQSLGDLGAYLQAIDRYERELLTNSVLLAAVFLHPVLDAYQNGKAAYGLSEGKKNLNEVARLMLHSVVQRIRLPKREAERIQQLISSHQYLFGLGVTARLPRGLMRRIYFPEALDLFEIGVLAKNQKNRTLTRLKNSFRPPKKTLLGNQKRPSKTRLKKRRSKMISTSKQRS